MSDNFPFDEGEDWEDFTLPRHELRVFPDDLMMHGQESSGEYSVLQIDANNRLVLDQTTFKYIARLPGNINSSVTTLVTGVAGQDLVSIDVVNTSDLARTLRLWAGTSAVDANIFGAVTTTIAPYSSWKWRGVMTLEGTAIFGQASAGGSLKAYCTLRWNRRYVR